MTHFVSFSCSCLVPVSCVDGDSVPSPIVMPACTLIISDLISDLKVKSLVNTCTAIDIANWVYWYIVMDFSEQTLLFCYWCYRVPENRPNEGVFDHISP